MRRHLSGAHAQTLNKIFEHPISHNLEWRDVRSMFGEMGEVTEEHNGNLRISLNGNDLMLAAPHGNDVASADELMKIRHFLQSCGHDSLLGEDDAKDLLIVIDHAEALVYSMEMEDKLPKKITPHDPHGLGRHFHTIGTDISIHEKANRKSFYEGITKTVEGAERILVFGDGKGSSSEMGLFLDELEERHPTIFALVVGSTTVDINHASEGELVARAREWFEKTPVVTV